MKELVYRASKLGSFVTRVRAHWAMHFLAKNKRIAGVLFAKKIACSLCLYQNSNLQKVYETHINFVSIQYAFPYARQEDFLEIHQVAIKRAVMSKRISEGPSFLSFFLSSCKLVH